MHASRRDGSINTTIERQNKDENEEREMKEDAARTYVGGNEIGVPCHCVVTTFR